MSARGCGARGRAHFRRAQANNGGSACGGKPCATEVLNLMAKVNELKATPATSWLQLLSQAQQQKAGTIHPRGWFWWTGALLSYLMRPSPMVFI